MLNGRVNMRLAPLESTPQFPKVAAAFLLDMVLHPVTCLSLILAILGVWNGPVLLLVFLWGC